MGLYHGLRITSFEDRLYILYASRQHSPVEDIELKKVKMKIMRFPVGLFLFGFCLSLFFYGREVEAAKAFNYLVPDAASREYSQEEIGCLSLTLTCYAKNEIYARHGRRFVSEELQYYFNQQPWYNGTIDGASFSENVFNSYERANIDLLARRERMLSSDGTGYKLDGVGYKDRSDAALLAYFSDSYNIFSGMSAHLTSGQKVVNADDFVLSIPADPETYVMQNDRRSFTIYYAAAKDQGLGGRIVTIKAYGWHDESNDYSSYPSWQIAGANADYLFVALYPTDLQYDASSATQKSEYASLMNWAKSMDYHSGSSGNPFKGID